MGEGLIKLALTLIVILILLICWFVFSIIKKQKKGWIISGILILIISSFFFINYFDEWSLNKKDVKMNLSYLNIHLNYPFEILNNTVTGMPERYQETEILINLKDASSIKYQCINNQQIDSSFTANPSEINKYYKEIDTVVDNIHTTFTLELNDQSGHLKYQMIQD